MPTQKKAHVFTEVLTSEQKAKLKSLAHHLKPVIQIGAQGFSENVKKEIILALSKHELIKVQLPPDTDAQTKDSSQSELESILPKHAHLVARIGRTIILYLEKKPDEQKIKLKI